MDNNKQLNDKLLDNVDGGTDLEKYLKSLTGNDKNKVLVDYGTGVELDNNPSIDYDKQENIIIVKRDKSTPEK